VVFGEKATRNQPHNQLTLKADCHFQFEKKIMASPRSNINQTYPPSFAPNMNYRGNPNSNRNGQNFNREVSAPRGQAMGNQFDMMGQAPMGHVGGDPIAECLSNSYTNAMMNQMGSRVSHARTNNADGHIESTKLARGLHRHHSDTSAVAHNAHNDISRKREFLVSGNEMPLDGSPDMNQPARKRVLSEGHNEQQASIDCFGPERVTKSTESMSCVLTLERVLNYKNRTMDEVGLMNCKSFVLLCSMSKNTKICRYERRSRRVLVANNSRKTLWQ